MTTTKTIVIAMISPKAKKKQSHTLIIDKIAFPIDRESPPRDDVRIN
jgi:hypothetical protein